MTSKVTTTVDDLWETAALRRCPPPSPAEQRAGIVLLGELAKGEPVTIGQLAQALGKPADAIEALVKDSALAPFVHTGDGGAIQGFMGLAVIRTPHQLIVNGQKLWAWCAYDTLFLPGLLGETAEIETRDPQTDELICLSVSPTRVEAVQPSGIVASMVRPDMWNLTSAAQVRTSACHFMFFFASRASGERWQAMHPRTVLLSLDEAFAFGKRSNAHRFGAELARRRRDVA